MIAEALAIVCTFLPAQCDVATHVTIIEADTGPTRGAYYEPSTHSIVVKANADSAVEAGYLAHELTHAMQSPAILRDCRVRETEAFTVQANLWSAYHGNDPKYAASAGWVSTMVKVDCG